DVSEPHAVAVVLQPDVAAHAQTVVRPRRKLAAGDPRAPILAALLVLEYPCTVEPVLDVRSARDDAHGVPLPYRARHVRRRGVQPKVRSGGRERTPAVRMTIVVQHLHLGARLEDVVGFLAGAVEDAAVAAR